MGRRGGGCHQGVLKGYGNSRGGLCKSATIEGREKKTREGLKGWAFSQEMEKEREKKKKATQTKKKKKKKNTDAGRLS